MKGIKDPKKVIKFIADGGNKGRANKILSQIRDYSNDPSIIKKIESSLGLEIKPFYEELIDDSSFKKIEETLANNWRNLGIMGLIEARMLYSICRAIKPKKIFETGVANGLSSTIFLLALAKNEIGTLFSIDISSDNIKSKKGATALPSGKKVGWLIPQVLRKNWQFNVGDSKKILPSLLKQQNYCDIFFHDSDHSYDYMMWEFETVRPFIKKMIISDDISRNSAFDDFASKHGYSEVKITQNVGIITINHS